MAAKISQRETVRSIRTSKALHNATLELLEDRRLFSGTLDPSFGVSGTAIANLIGPTDVGVDSVARTSDGKTIAVGVDGSVTVARYSNNGQLDTTFANSGYEQLPTAGTHFPFQAGVNYPQADINGASVFVQPDGKVLINIAWSGPMDNVVSWPFDVMRLNANGTKDTTFGNNGEVFLNFANSFASGSRALGVTPSGDIVVAGDSLLYTDNTQDITVAYLTPAGTLDTNYGGGTGVVQTHLTNGTEFSQVDSIAFDSSGRLLVAGRLGALYNPNNANLAVARFNTDGSLDTTFNSTGWIYTTGISQNVPTQVAVGAAGQVDITESTPSLAVLQYTSAGVSDSGFGTGGKVVLNIGTSGAAVPGVLQAISRLPSGELVAAGYDTSTRQLFSANISSNGHLDSGSLAGYVPNASPATALVLSNGAVIFGGSANDINSLIDFTGFFVANLNTAGTLDPTFGTSGYTYTTIIAAITGAEDASVVQPDGKVIVAGTADTSAFLVRFNTDGSIDTSFGTNGQELVPLFFPTQTLDSIGLQSNGDIVLDANGGNLGSSTIELARLLPNGLIDNSFGTNNNGRMELAQVIQSASPSDQATVMAIQPDDRIVLAGYSGQTFFVLRLNANGTNDSTFHFNVAAMPPVGYPSAIAIAPGGDILVGGSTLNLTTLKYTDDNLVRLLSNGTLDPTFGSGGLVTAPAERIRSIALQPNGQIVVGGSGKIERFNSSDGSLDTTFNGTGVYTLPISGTTSLGVNDVAVLSNGDILTADANGGTITLTQLQSNGTLDSTFGNNGVANSSAGVYNFANNLTGNELGLLVRSSGAIVVTGDAMATSTATNYSYVAAQFTGSAPPIGGNIGGTVTASGVGISGATVYLDANNNATLDAGEISTATAADGSYSFSNVSTGSYVIRQVLPAGYTQTTPASGGIGVTVSTGASLVNENFVDAVSTGSISGTVKSGSTPLVSVGIYLDANNNSVLDNGEEFATTDSNGNYSFIGIAPGSYVIRQIVPVTYMQTTPAANAGITITVAGGSILTNDNFVDVPTPGTISGSVTAGGVAVTGETVFLDANNNSLLDSGELSTVTNGSGAYSFSGVALGAYVIRQVLPAGYAQMIPANNAGLSVSISSASSFTGENFVDTAPAAAPVPLKGTTVGTAGSYQNDGNTIAKATDGNLSTFFDGSAANGNWVGLDLGTPTLITGIAYASRSGWASRMNGGIFQASNSATFATGVVNLYTIAANANPSSTSLTQQSITNSTAYRYVRYLSPASSFGNVSEVQFFGTVPVITMPVPLTGTVIGTSGSYQNDGNTIAKAFDGSLSTYVDGSTANGNWAGLDLGAPTVISSIAYASRSGWASRMNGGIFQASNSAAFTSGVVNLYTIAANANPSSTAFTTVAISGTSAYRYVRYLSPAGSFGNVAEIQFFGGPPATQPLLTKFAGTAIGTTGSYQGDGNTIAKALDGNLNTFFDAAAADGDWVGLDLGSPRIVKQISFAPRSGYASRMVGGIFQASNTADFSSGVINIYTVNSAPASGVITNVTVSVSSAFEYYRYLAPDNSEGNVAEISFYG